MKADIDKQAPASLHRKFHALRDCAMSTVIAENVHRFVQSYGRLPKSIIQVGGDHAAAMNEAVAEIYSHYRKAGLRSEL